MGEYQSIFKRYEKKYLLNRLQYEQLLPILEQYMAADSYGLHTICNIYYDTQDYQLIRTSLEKPDYKEKLRLRSYGVPGADDTVYVEIKKKFDGVVYKRRCAMRLAEAEAYLKERVYMGERGQILNEIDWCLRRYHLQPAAYIAYDRRAFAGRGQTELRVTFDEKIRFRERLLELAAGSFGTTILPEEYILMEVKIPGGMPLWMSHALSWLGIYSTSYSKYGVCYDRYLAPGLMKRLNVRPAAKTAEKEEGGKICA